MKNTETQQANNFRSIFFHSCTVYNKCQAVELNLKDVDYIYMYTLIYKFTCTYFSEKKKAFQLFASGDDTDVRENCVSSMYSCQLQVGILAWSDNKN